MISLDIGGRHGRARRRHAAHHPRERDRYMANVVTEKDAFLQRLPELIEKNLASGDIANEE